MTHSEDYKRGLLDMLDALTERDNDGLYRSIYSQNTILNLSVESSPILIAIKYRAELESRKALQDAVNLLEENGYYVALPHLIFEYEKAAEYLRKGGYTVTKPGVNPGPPLMSTDQMIDALWESGYAVYPKAPGTPRQQPAARPGAGHASLPD